MNGTYVLCFVLVYFIKVNVNAIGGGGVSLGPWQALMMSPKGLNASRNGFVNLIISLNSIASFGSVAP